MDDESMALVAAFARLHDAKPAQALLEPAGIPTFLRNENAGRGSLAYSSAEHGLSLFVPANAELEASELLHSRISPEDLADHGK